jgi:hypothetical protein
MDKLYQNISYFTRTLERCIEFAESNKLGSSTMVELNTTEARELIKLLDVLQVRDFDAEHIIQRQQKQINELQQSGWNELSFEERGKLISALARYY